MAKKFFLALVILLGLSGLLLGAPASLLSSGGQSPYHLVVLGDPHLPGKYLPGKEAVIRTINSWSDAALVVAVGDICEDVESEQEFAAARQFFHKLTKPFLPIPGNHDFIYSEIKMPSGKKIMASAAEKREKLAAFQRTFGIPALYHAKSVADYKLIFLATDDLPSDQLTRMSSEKLAWLRSELNRDKKCPTIIFFHGPLNGTLSNYNNYANSNNFIAQPQNEIHKILQENPQIFLWVCGHMHVPATNKDFRADINSYENRVYTLHNADMNRDTIWTNSLFFFPDKVVIKTYNHRLGAWMPELEKTLVPPRL